MPQYEVYPVVCTWETRRHPISVTAASKEEAIERAHDMLDAEDSMWDEKWDMTDCQKVTTVQNVDEV